MSSYIYIGPNIFSLGLQQHQLFLVKEPNRFLQKLMEEKHWIGSMFIPTPELAEARKRIDRPGTVEYQAFRYLKEISREQIKNLLESQ